MGAGYPEAWGLLAAGGLGGFPRGEVPEGKDSGSARNPHQVPKFKFFPSQLRSQGFPWDCMECEDCRIC